MTALPALAVAATATAVVAAGVPVALAAAQNAATRARVLRQLLETASPRFVGAAAGAGVSGAPVGVRSSLRGRVRARFAPVLPRLTAVRDRRRRSAALPHVLTRLAQHLRAGGSLAQAISLAAAAAPPALAPELHGVVHRARHGSGLVAGLRWWATVRSDDEAVRMVAASLAVAAETGGPAVHAVEVVAELVRNSQDLAGEVRALTAQARASAFVMALAPLAMALIAAASDPGMARFLFTTGAGLAMLAAGVVLDGLGVAWMALLLRRHR